MELNAFIPPSQIRSGSKLLVGDNVFENFFDNLRENLFDGNSMVIVGPVFTIYNLNKQQNFFSHLKMSFYICTQYLQSRINPSVTNRFSHIYHSR